MQDTELVVNYLLEKNLYSYNMNSYLSLVIFLIITIAYFWFAKINMPFSTNPNENQEDTKQKYLEFSMSNVYRLLVYFSLIVLTQVVLNVVYVSQLCGGSISENIGIGSLLAFIPWIFIFGSVIVLLIIFPGLKTVFSNVLGYFAISYKANQILNDILVDLKIEEDVSKIQDPNEKLKMEKVADMIVKLVSNKSLLINEFNPINFNTMWRTITPLIKNGVGDINSIKEEFFNLVILKDNIGEMFWYIYTAIFLVSVVSYNTISKGCNRSVKAMQNNLNDYESKSKELSSTKTSTSQLYNI